MSESNEKIIDNPQGWVQDHIKEYLESDGKKGHIWRGSFPTLLLTYRGRKSGSLPGADHRLAARGGALARCGTGSLWSQ